MSSGGHPTTPTTFADRTRRSTDAPGTRNAVRRPRGAGDEHDAGPGRGTGTGRRRRHGGRHPVRRHADPPRLGSRALHGAAAVRAGRRRGRSRELRRRRCGSRLDRPARGRPHRRTRRSRRVRRAGRRRRRSDRRGPRRSGPASRGRGPARRRHRARSRRQRPDPPARMGPRPGGGRRSRHPARAARARSRRASHRRRPRPTQARHRPHAGRRRGRRLLRSRLARAGSRGDRRDGTGRGVRRRRRGARPHRVRDHGARRPLLRARRTERRFHRDRPVRGGAPSGDRAWNRAGAVLAHGVAPDDGAGAVRGGGGPDQARDRPDVPARAGGRRARRHRSPRGHRQDAAPDQRSAATAPPRSPTSSAPTCAPSPSGVSRPTGRTGRRRSIPLPTG